jgi:uncharacterized RDD family membrane protein YckC
MNALDTVRRYETPEGIELEMRLAGPVVRACAWLIDAGIRLLLYIGLAILFAYMGDLGTGVMLIGFFLIEWFYPVLFEVQQGMTPGKKAMGIWVIHDNGTPISWPSALIRNLLRAADFFPFFYGAGLLTMLANRDFKRLGDLAAGTLVVYREPKRERHPLPASEPRPPPPGLTLDDQQTLLSFAERSKQLSPQRRSELAVILAPITSEGGEGAEGVIYGYANWMTRGR